ncbi:MAG: branched-chain amino acid ABC transporter substrate-binding protein [Dehalococcoidia bacterium]
MTLALALFAAGACRIETPDKGDLSAAPGAAVRIAVLSERQGPHAAEGQGIVNAALLAAERAGAVRGHPIEVTVHDGGCDPAASLATVAELASDPRLVGIVGPICSAACVAVAGTLDKAAVAMVSPRCTDIAVTRQGYNVVFRTAWTDALEAAATAKLAWEHLKVRKVFVVNDGTVYSRGLRDAFRLFFGKENLAGNEEALIGSEDYGPVIRAITKSRAGMVYYAGFAEDAARFVRQLRAAGVALPVAVPDAAKDAGLFIEAAGGAAEGVYVTEVQLERDERERLFVADYRKRWGAEPPAFAAEAYDATRALIEAIATAGSAGGGRLVADRRDLVDAVKETDLRGATGRLQFLRNGDRAEGAAVRVLRVEGGHFVPDRVIRLDEKRTRSASPP